MGWLGLLAVFALLLLLWQERAQVRRLRALASQTEEVRAAHQALLRVQSHMDEFIASVGHELRTPMGAILGLNGVLRRELADRPDDMQTADRIRQATQQLLQIADKMLEFSRLQAGKVQLCPSDFDLPAALRQLIARREAQAQQKGLALQWLDVQAAPPQVRMDRTRLLQVLDELLDNAIRHTREGQVVLRVRQQAGRLRCEVQDTGCGITQARQALLFKPFEPFAAGAAESLPAGSGLGLTVCARWVERMGGAIGVYSTPGQGATFWLDLPFEPAGQAALSQNDGAGLQADAPLDILLVDDNEVNRMVARLQLLQIWPRARIASADSAAQALQCLETQGFDVALVDLLMPDMDGVALARQMRQRLAATALRMPIIALTAHTDALERERCLAAGMDEVLHKPVDPWQLQHSVSDLVARARRAAP